jgi:hypothetical protein
VPLNSRMPNPGRYKTETNEEYIFEFQDSALHRHTHMLQYFNKTIKCIYFFLKTGVHRLCWLFKQSCYYQQNELCIKGQLTVSFSDVIVTAFTLPYGHIIEILLKQQRQL